MSALADSIRARLADDAAAVAEDYRQLVQDAAAGKADTEAAAAFFFANPSYALERFDREVAAIVEAKQLHADRVAAVAKLESHDAKACRRNVAAAEKVLADLDAEREAWLAAFIRRRTEAEQRLKGAREVEGEPERLRSWLEMTADPAKRSRLAALPGIIRDAERKVADLNERLANANRVASQRPLEANEFLRDERTGARLDPAAVEANKGYAAKAAAKLRDELVGAEYALKSFQAELQALPAELLAA